MTTRDWQQLDRTIARMSEDEKRRLIERIERALPGRADATREPRRDEEPVTVSIANQQRDAWNRLRGELAKHPIGNGDTTVSENYRSILYGADEDNTK